MNCATISTVIPVVTGLVNSDSEDDLAAMLAVKLVRRDRNCIPRYYEDVVGKYFEFEFKRLFRLSHETFINLADRS